MGDLHIHPDARAMLEARGLASFDALWAAADQPAVDGHRTRSVARLDLVDAAGRPVAIYVKRLWGAGARGSWRDLLRLSIPQSSAEREWENTLALARAGVPVAAPVACGTEGSGDGARALIATREAPGWSLAAWLFAARHETPPAPAERRAVAEAVGRAVRRLHDAGLSFPDLYAKHLYLDRRPDGTWRVSLIDVARLRRRLPWRAAEDLAALLVSTEGQDVTHTDRLRVLLAYSGTDRLEAGARRFARRVLRLAARMPGRGRDPNYLDARRTAPPGVVPTADEVMTDVDGGRLRINEAFRPVLEAAGLTTLDALMTVGGGKVFRDKPGEGRLTVELALSDPRGGECVVYLKRYTRVPWRLALRRTLGWNEPVSQARHEASCIVRLADQGIASMRRVAVGQELACGGRKERSCLVTERIAGAVEADRWVEQQFAGAITPEKADARRRFVLAVARLARRLHAARLVHRDFYLCHILVRPMEGGDPVLHVIDLQRMKWHRRRMPDRWRVKDLAALLFSSWPSAATHVRTDLFTREDWEAFAREYFGTDRFSWRQRLLMLRVYWKARLLYRRAMRRGGAPEEKRA
jgi:hypothetical protein